MNKKLVASLIIATMLPTTLPTTVFATNQDTYATSTENRGGGF